MTTTHTKRNPCAACGTSPVNHTLMFTSAIIDGAFENTVGLFFGLFKFSREGRLANIVSALFTNLLVLTRLARYSSDITRAVSGRSKLIWEEAARRGISMQQIVVVGKYLEQYRARIGSRWIYFQSIPIPDWMNQGGYDWMDDKWKLGKRLERAGIAAPKVATLRSLRKARRLFENFTKPVIVKPRSGSRGRHTTTNIQTLHELESAWRLGFKIAPTLVMEEHLFGSVYRATVIDGKLVGFFRADPPQITGDGIHTTAQLIEEKNKAKATQLDDIKINDDLISFINRKGYALESIIPKDIVLDLSAKTGRMYGGYTKEMLPEVHPKMHEIFARAGAVVDVPIVGFDLIIPDPKADPDAQKWGIIEANSLPFIDLHYFALEGTPINLAKNVWDLWEKKYGTRR